jgi:hypothetical protein
MDKKTHRSVGKETGETAHMERWKNTLRQRNGRYVRETLSFSKSDFWHQIVTEMFIVYCCLQPLLLYVIALSCIFAPLPNIRLPNQGQCLLLWQSEQIFIAQADRALANAK